MSACARAWMSARMGEWVDEWAGGQARVRPGKVGRCVNAWMRGRVGAGMSGLVRGWMRDWVRRYVGGFERGQAAQRAGGQLRTCGFLNVTSKQCTREFDRSTTAESPNCDNSEPNSTQQRPNVCSHNFKTAQTFPSGMVADVAQNAQSPNGMANWLWGNELRRMAGGA